MISYWESFQNDWLFQRSLSQKNGVLQPALLRHQLWRPHWSLLIRSHANLVLLIITNGNQVAQSHWIPNWWLGEERVLEQGFEYASQMVLICSAVVPLLASWCWNKNNNILFKGVLRNSSFSSVWNPSVIKYIYVLHRKELITNNVTAASVWQ
jgi:hypothetical protein